MITPKAEGKQITIVEEIAPVFYIRTEADRDMMHRAILNPPSNAVKYTPEGGQYRSDRGRRNGEEADDLDDTA